MVRLFVTKFGKMGVKETGKLTKEEQEKQVERLTYPKQETPIRDPFPVCPSKQVSQSDMDKTVERLYKVSIEKKEGEKEQLTEKYYAKPPAAKLSGDDMQSSIDRQYSEEIERRKQRMEESKQRWQFHSKAQTKVVSNSEFVQRMYHDRIEQKKATEKKLYDRYIVPTEIHQKAVSRQRIEEASNRLSKRDE